MQQYRTPENPASIPDAGGQLLAPHAVGLYGHCRKQCEMESHIATLILAAMIAVRADAHDGKLGLTLHSEKMDGERVYRVTDKPDEVAEASTSAQASASAQPRAA